MSKGITYRLVRALFEAQADRGSMNLRIDLCCAEDFTIDVGPHPGFSDPQSCVIGIKFFGQPDRPLIELAFAPEDDLPARQLGEALTAWADWIEAELAKEAESPASDEIGAVGAHSPA